MAELIDFETLRRPLSPNTCLAAPEGLCKRAKADTPGPMIAEEPDVVFGRLRQLVEARSDWSLRAANDAEHALAFVATSRVLRFKDDVDVRVLSAEGGSTVAIYSRSRLGYSDLGANRKRVDRLLADLIG